MRKLDGLCAPGIPAQGRRRKRPGRRRKTSARPVGKRRRRPGSTSNADRTNPNAGEEQEEGHKVLWQLAGTDYSAVYITADEKERIDSITAFVRPEKQMPSDAVGEVAKAPVKDDSSVVWDVLRPGQPLFRVVAKGSNGKVSSIRLFVVQHKGVPVVHYLKKAGDDTP